MPPPWSPSTSYQRVCTGLCKSFDTSSREKQQGVQERFAEQWAEPVELVLPLLPCWEGLSEDQRQCAVRRLLEQVEVEARNQGMSPLRSEAVKAQAPHTRPARLKHSPRPLGHASAREALQDLRERYREFVSALREASARWRHGDFWVSFPPFSFPPREPGRRKGCNEVPEHKGMRCGDDSVCRPECTQSSPGGPLAFPDWYVCDAEAGGFAPGHCVPPACANATSPYGSLLR